MLEGGANAPCTVAVLNSGGRAHPVCLYPDSGAKEHVSAGHEHTNGSYYGHVGAAHGHTCAPDAAATYAHGGAAHADSCAGHVNFAPRQPHCGDLHAYGDAGATYCDSGAAHANSGCADSDSSAGSGDAP